MHLVAAAGAQPFQLALILHPLGNGFHVQPCGQIEHRGHDCWTVARGRGAVGQVRDKTTVDFDLVEWKTAQIVERGIACAEIVKRDPHPQTAQPVQHIEALRRVFDQHGFCDFQFQPRRIKPAGRQRADHLTQNLATAQLHCRNIHRHGQMVRPRRCLGQRLAQHPFADRHDQPGFFGLGNELRRLDQPAFCMIPPDQRLKPDDRARHQAHQRLIIEFKTPLRECQTQFDFQFLPIGLAAQQVRVVHDNAPATRRFGFVLRQIGRAQQFVAICAVLARQRPADAGADAQHARIELDRQGQRCNHLVTHRRHRTRRGNPGQQNRELIAPQPRHQPALTNDARQSRGGFHQHQIARRMAIRIVDQFEPVEIDEHHCKHLGRVYRPRVGPLQPHRRRIKPGVEFGAVGNLRQSVVAGQKPHPRFGLMPVCHIANESAKSGVLAARIEHRAARGEPPAHSLGRDHRRHHIAERFHALGGGDNGIAPGSGFVQLRKFQPVDCVCLAPGHTAQALRCPPHPPGRVGFHQTIAAMFIILIEQQLDGFVGGFQAACAQPPRRKQVIEIENAHMRAQRQQQHQRCKHHRRGA